MQTNWLTTPHVPNEKLNEVPARNGLSIKIWDRKALPFEPHDLDWKFAGFAFGQVTYFRYASTDDEGLWQANASELGVPIWALAFLAALPMLGLLKRRPGIGCCPQCGYDLRATPARCPECGASASQKIEA
jgi:hypothetical protein